MGANVTTDESRDQRDRRHKEPSKFHSIRIPPETERKLQQLTIWLNRHNNKVLLYAIERLYEDEAKKRGLENMYGE